MRAAGARMVVVVANRFIGLPSSEMMTKAGTVRPAGTTAAVLQSPQRPLKTGFRFSAKAFQASCVSSVEASATVCDCSKR